MAARGIRNNNPGNIVKTKKKWAGEIDGNDPKFKTFISMNWGIRAIFALLKSYNVKYNLTTLPAIFNKYAPKDNEGTDPVIYANNISKWTGIPKDKKISWTDKETMIKLVYYITKQENGGGVTLAQVKEGAALFYGNKIYSAPTEEKKKEEIIEKPTPPKYVWTTVSIPPTNIPKEAEKPKKELNRVLNDPSIKNEIPLDQISVSQEAQITSFLETNKQKTYESIGLDCPIVIIKDICLTEEEILNLEIDCNDFLPKIFLMIAPATKSLTTTEVPKDGDVISVFIKSTNNMLKPIRNDYLITSCDVINNEINYPNTKTIIKLQGELFVPSIYADKNYTSVGTSKEALKYISKELKLGFAFNDHDDTSDLQIWLSPKKNAFNFIKEIADHAWKDECSYFKTWIDPYYNLTFINVNKTLISPDDLDVTIGTLTSILKSTPPDPDEKNAKAQIKILTNSPSYKNTSLFLYKTEVTNNVSQITKKFGAHINNSMFIANQNFLNKNNDGHITLQNLQTYDTNKLEDFSILRGRNKFDINYASNGSVPYSNFSVDEINSKSEWTGPQYTISDSDTGSDNKIWSGNVHKNYNRATSHNEMNNEELNKLYIIATVAGPCLQILKGEKIPILIYGNNELDITPNGVNPKTFNINKFYSGYYYVDGIKIIYKNNEDTITSTKYRTELTLKRREWPIPKDYKKDNV